MDPVCLSIYIIGYLEPIKERRVPLNIFFKNQALNIVRSKNFFSLSVTSEKPKVIRGA
jgi:hypothetical protein